MSFSWPKPKFYLAIPKFHFNVNRILRNQLYLIFLQILFGVCSKSYRQHESGRQRRKKMKHLSLRISSVLKICVFGLALKNSQQISFDEILASKISHALEKNLSSLSKKISLSIFFVWVASKFDVFNGNTEERQG